MWAYGVDGGDKGGGGGEDRSNIFVHNITYMGTVLIINIQQAEIFFNRSGFSCSYYLVSTIINYH
jgi:hypothetical protein